MDKVFKNETKTMQDLKGFREAVDHFTAIDGAEPSSDSLRNYIHEKADAGDPLSDFDYALDELFLAVDSPDAATRQTSERKVQMLVQFIKARMEVIRNAQHKLRDATVASEIPTNPIINTVKSVFGGVAEGWNNSDGQGKLIMAAGAISAFILWRTLEDQKNTPDTASFAGSRRVLGKSLATLRTATGIVIGGGLAWMGLSAANKAFEKSSGAPLINLNINRDVHGPWFPALTEKNREQWNANKHKIEINQEWERLRGMSVPVERFSEFASAKPEKRKHAFGITNLSALSTKEFRSLYETYKDTKQIPDDAAPKHPFSKDFLSPVERFNLLEKMADSLHFIDLNRSEMEWKEDEIREKQNMMYLILDFENINSPQKKVALLEQAKNNPHKAHYEISCRAFAWHDGANYYLYSLINHELITVDKDGTKIDRVPPAARPGTIVSPDGFDWGVDPTGKITILKPI